MKELFVLTRSRRIRYNTIKPRSSRGYRATSHENGRNDDQKTRGVEKWESS